MAWKLHWLLAIRVLKLGKTQNHNPEILNMYCIYFIGFEDYVEMSQCIFLTFPHYSNNLITENPKLLIVPEELI